MLIDFEPPDDLFTIPPQNPATIVDLAEQFLSYVAAAPNRRSFVRMECLTDHRSRRLFRPLLACLAGMSESPTPVSVYGGTLEFRRGRGRRVHLLADFANRPGEIWLAFRVRLYHGTTLDRARAIEQDGPNPSYYEPDSEGVGPPAEGFSTCPEGVVYCPTGLPAPVAYDVHRRFPNEGGPAILEVVVTPDIIQALYADPVVGMFLAPSGEYRFEPESGLNELRATWHTLVRRVIPLPLPPVG